MVKPDSPPVTIGGHIFFTFDFNGKFPQNVIYFLDNSDNTYIRKYKLINNNTVITLYGNDIKTIKYKVLKIEKDSMKWEYEYDNISASTE